MSSRHLEDKCVGALLGAAVGDAIGELAFQHPKDVDLEAAIISRSILRYTDDTAMAIALAESLLRTGEVDSQDLGDAFLLAYEREPWRGYAAGPPTVFRMVRRLGLPYPEAAARLYGGAGSFGNGAAMRVAPVGILFARPAEAYRQGVASAAVTHAHAIGKDGAGLQAVAVSRAIQADPAAPLAVADFVAELLQRGATKEMRAKISLLAKLLEAGVAPGEAVRELGQSVAVHESLPFAWYSFLSQPYSFVRCIHCAVLNGGDRDTLGAMAGALGGAFLGFRAIASRYSSRVESRQYLKRLALRLAAKRKAMTDRCHEG